MEPSEIFWIDVNNSYPDDGMTVLIAADDEGFVDVETGYRDAGGWYDESSNLMRSKVTHWADFPDPPEAAWRFRS